jgi:hypothetical protein
MKTTFVAVALIMGFTACTNRMNCPTTNPRYFYQKMGVKKTPRMSTGKKRGSYGNTAYVVPPKYRKGITNYGKLK